MWWKRVKKIAFITRVGIGVVRQSQGCDLSLELHVDGVG